VVGQPKVIVEEITNDLASCLAKNAVPVQFSARRTLGKIEKAHARVNRDELAGNGAGDIGHTVADD